MSPVTHTRKNRAGTYKSFISERTPQELSGVSTALGSGPVSQVHSWIPVTGTRLYADHYLGTVLSL